MFERFYPSADAASAYEIAYEKLYAQGYRGIIFDIDNTLVPHGAPADPRVISLFERLRSIGFSTCLLSNNKEARVRPFAEAVQSAFIANAHKPSSGNYIQACRKIGSDQVHCLFVGDQLFTDVWGGKKAGLYTILVRPIHPKEEIQIVLKRMLEKIVLRFYEKKKGKR